MNSADKQILARLYGCVQEMTRFAPSNPADIGRHVKASQVLRERGRDVAMVISMLGYGDYEDCRETLAMLEGDLGLDVGIGLRDD